MTNSTYSIVMFAYNEEENIEQSILSIKQQVSDNLECFYIVANGCTDNTVSVAEAIKKREKFDKLNIIELVIGDKCNAWNHYVHNVAKPVDVHFFVDADVRFSDQCFDKMSQHLSLSPEQTVTIAGMPLSGRNKAFYESLVKERSCFFGNLYGLRNSFIERLKTAPFKLPKGLNWIDSFLTKAVNTDLTFGKQNLPNRVTYLEGAGYLFDNLSVFSLSDIKLYISRIARYELGKVQEKYLDALDVKNWPSDMIEINRKIEQNLAQDISSLSWIKKRLVTRRLYKLLKKQH